MSSKTALYEQFGRIGKALGSAARLEILDLLAQSEKTVEQIAEQARLGVKNASAHLRVLREARLVETRKEPPYVYYRLADDEVASLVRTLQKLAYGRLAEVANIARDYLSSPLGLEPVGLSELKRRLSSGAVTLLDVRPAEEFEAGHLPGALSVPVDELDKRLPEIPADRPVIAYCRGEYCVNAVRAVETLRKAGRQAEHTDVGVPDWRSSGNPVSVAGAARARMPRSW